MAREPARQALAEGPVHEVLLQQADAAVGLVQLVDRPVDAHRAAPEQATEPGRVAAAAADPGVAEVVLAAQAVEAVGVVRPPQLAFDLGAQLRREALVGVEHEYPVVGEATALQAGRALAGVVDEGLLQHPHTTRLGALGGAVGAEGIEHQHVVAEGDGIEAGVDLRRLVVGEDGDGEHRRYPMSDA